ncbi:MAG: 4-hydroxyproline epimerase [Ferruginibacter sp.]
MLIKNGSAYEFNCIDAHTCGNPVRLVASGGPDLEGNSMREKRLNFLREFDWIRTGLMFEPRGHDMMSGSILYPPADPLNDIGVLFLETSGCLPMCGHGSIGTITIAIENNLIKPKIPGKVRMETPAGLVEVSYQMENGKVKFVKLVNVPCFLAAEKLSVTSSHLGEILFDVAYGGNFYAIVDEQENYSGIQDFTAAQLISFSGALRKSINEKYSFVHPEDSNISGCSHILWTGGVLDKKSTARNAVFYGDKAIDRSPCGTGTSARMAQWFAQEKLKPGETFIHESYIGSKFTGTIEAICTVGEYKAIRPGIEGWAKVYGKNKITIDPADDPFAYGFQVI